MDINRVLEKIDNYFDNVSDEQLTIDLEESGYSHYKNVKEIIFSDEDEFFFNSEKAIATKSTFKIKDFNYLNEKFVSFNRVLTADDYQYFLAA